MLTKLNIFVENSIRAFVGYFLKSHSSSFTVIQVVWIVLPENTGKRDIKVNLKPRAMEVLFKGEKYMGGNLQHILQSDSLTWTIQKGRLEIIMEKVSCYYVIIIYAFISQEYGPMTVVPF